MTLKDLRTGDIIETRTGHRGIVIDTIIFFDNGTEDIQYYNNEMFVRYSKTGNFQNSAGDIEKVYRITGNPKYFVAVDFRAWFDDNTPLPQAALIWERNPVKKVTVAELEKILGYKIEIIAEQELLYDELLL